jgi:hypothetical protein
MNSIIFHNSNPQTLVNIVELFLLSRVMIILAL